MSREKRTFFIFSFDFGGNFTLTTDLLASYASTLNAKGQRTRVEEGFGGAVLRTISYVYPSTGSGQALMRIA